VTSGFVPRKAIGMRRDWLSGGLAAIAPTFRFGPVMVDPKRIRMPIASELHGSWSWCHRVTPTTWQEDEVVNATGDAQLPLDPVQGRLARSTRNRRVRHERRRQGLRSPIGRDRPRVADWQHSRTTARRAPAARAMGALDFDRVPPGGVGRWRLVGPAPITTRNEQMFTGPGPVAGQVRDLAIDPRFDRAPTLYAAGNSAGIWKSTDGGDSWNPINDQPVVGIGAIALDPDDPDTVYAASGNLFDGSHGDRRGAGLYKSTDGGATWVTIDGGSAALTSSPPVFRIVALASQMATAQRLCHPPTAGEVSRCSGRCIRASSGRSRRQQRTTRRVRDASATSPIVLRCTRHGSERRHGGRAGRPGACRRSAHVRVVDADH
jgi:hypothetical protein